MEIHELSHSDGSVLPVGLTEREKLEQVLLGPHESSLTRLPGSEFTFQRAAHHIKNETACNGSNREPDIYCEHYPSRPEPLQLHVGLKMDNTCLEIKDTPVRKRHRDHLLGLVQNRQFDSSLEYKRAIWTGFELPQPRTEAETEYEHLSMPPVPSLSSSTVSSVGGNINDYCLTPDPFETTNTIPILSIPPAQYGNSKQCTSQSAPSIIFPSDNEDFDNLGEGVKSSQIPREHRKADSCHRDLNSKDRYPLNFCCEYCRETFPFKIDLEQHLVTHKRYRNYLRNQRRSKELELECERRTTSMSGCVPLHEALAYLDRHVVTAEEESGTKDNITEMEYQHRNAHVVPLKSPIPSPAGSIKTEASTSRIAQSPSITHWTNLKRTHNFNNIPSLLYSQAKNKIHKANRRRMSRSRDSAHCIVRTTQNLIDFPDAAVLCSNVDASFSHLEISNLLVDTLISTMRQGLMSSFMNEFLAISLQNGKSNIRNHGTGADSSRNGATQPAPSTTRGSSQGFSADHESRMKRNGGEEEQDPDENEEDDDPRPPKRPRTSSPYSRVSLHNPKFACPYRKYDPRKYCVQHWRSCALTGLDTVARVKAHLYRHHKIYQCQRCKDLFVNQNILDEHILDLQGCTPNRSNIVEGLTPDIEKKLRSRKKTHSKQTEGERWIEIYQTLFPAAVPPSPYFEPVEESAEQSSDPGKLGDFGTYSQREFPKMFWAALEEVVANEMQPVEERLRAQLLGLMRECQGRVLSTYQSMVATTMGNLEIGHPTKDMFTNQLEPLSTAATEATFTNISNSEELDFPTPHQFNGTDHETYLSGFDSSTTLSSFFASSTALSSVFNSSTTLSSVTSTDVPAVHEPGIDELPEEIDYMSAYDFDITDKDPGCTKGLLDETWTTDLDEVDLRQLDEMGIQFGTGLGA